MVKNILLLMIVLVNGYFAVVFIRDLLKHREAVRQEPAKSG